MNWVPLLRLSCRPWLEPMQSVIGSWMKLSCCGYSDCVPPYYGGVGERFFHYRLIPNFYNIRLHTHHFVTIFPTLQNDFRLMFFFCFWCLYLDWQSQFGCLRIITTNYLLFYLASSFLWLSSMLSTLYEFLFGRFLVCPLFRYSNFYLVQV